MSRIVEIVHKRGLIEEEEEEIACEVKKSKLMVKNIEMKHYNWIESLRKRDADILAKLFYLNFTRVCFANDYADWDHHRAHNSRYDWLFESSPPSIISDPEEFYNLADKIIQQCQSSSSKMSICKNRDWEIYSSYQGKAEMLHGIIFNEDRTLIRINSAPILGSFQPHSLQSLCSSIVVSNIVHDKYDDDTCINLLTVTHNCKPLGNLSIRCGPSKSRRLFSFYSIIKNYCIERFTSNAYQMTQYFACIKNDPQPYCYSCMNMYDLEPHIRVNKHDSTRYCSLCDLLSKLLFTKTFETMNGHLNNCEHKYNVPSYYY